MKKIVFLATLLVAVVAADMAEAARPRLGGRGRGIRRSRVALRSRGLLGRGVIGHGVLGGYGLGFGGIGSVVLPTPVVQSAAIVQEEVIPAPAVVQSAAVAAPTCGSASFALGANYLQSSAAILIQQPAVLVSQVAIVRSRAYLGSRSLGRGLFGFRGGVRGFGRRR